MKTGIDVLYLIEAIRSGGPLDPVVYSRIGTVLRRLGIYDASLGCHRIAAESAPKDAELHSIMANTLLEMGETSVAYEAYLAALRLDPDHRNARHWATSIERLASGDLEDREALHFFAGVSKRRSKPQQAAALYRRAAGLRPGDAEAWRRLAGVEAKHEVDTEVATIERLFAQSTGWQRVHYAFGLGRWLHDLDDHERAAIAVIDANRTRASLQPAKRPPAFATPSRFPESSLRRPSGPIFIVGMPRSGKTTLERMLARHPNVRPLGELPLLPKLVRDGRQDVGADYLAFAHFVAPPPMVTVDTMPANAALIETIRTSIPDARVIHCVRETLPHRVAIFSKFFAKPAWAHTSSPSELVEAHRDHQAATSRWADLLPGFVLEVDVSRLDPATMQSVLEHCGLAPDPVCSEPVASEPRAGVARSCGERRIEPYRGLLA